MYIQRTMLAEMVKNYCGILCCWILFSHDVAWRIWLSWIDLSEKTPCRTQNSTLPSRESPRRILELANSRWRFFCGAYPDFRSSKNKGQRTASIYPFAGCATHYTSINCRGGKLNAYSAHIITLDGQLMKNQCLVLSKQVWYQISDPWWMKGLLGLD